MPKYLRSKYSFVLFLLLLCGLNSYAGYIQQKEIDSTLTFLKSHPQEDAEKVKALKYLSSLVQASNLRGAEYYAKKAVCIPGKEKLLMH